VSGVPLWVRGLALGLSGGLLWRARRESLDGGKGRRGIRGGGMVRFVGSRRRVGMVCMLVGETVGSLSAL